jgi:starvation-inducible DNA-binding protein
MATKSFIGLDVKSVQPVIDGLADLLANHQVYYSSLRGLHWDIKGDKFFELHELYEEYYDKEADVIDEIAERILKLGGHPENRFSEYLKVSEIKEIHNVSDWEKGLDYIVKSLNVFLQKYRNLNPVLKEAGDLGTNHFIVKQIEELETTLWKLNAYLG